MTSTPSPSAEMQATLDKIDKDVFDLCDALQNAMGALEPKPDVVKVQEYLHDWPPAWTKETLFHSKENSDVSRNLGTDKLREYIRQLERENRIMREAIETSDHTGYCTETECCCQHKILDTLTQ